MSAIPAPPPPQRPRRSSIGQAAAAIEAPQDSPTPPASRPAAVPTPAPPTRSTMKPIPLTIPEELKDRMLNTLTWTAPHTGISKQQVFIRRAIEALCGDLEAKYNQGRPFAPAASESPAAT